MVRTPCGHEGYMRKITLERYFKFVPQNDLQWLAVNVDTWVKWRDLPYITRTGDAWTYLSSDLHHPDSYTKEQWQRERYKSGLDDKPKYKYDWKLEQWVA